MQFFRGGRGNRFRRFGLGKREYVDGTRGRKQRGNLLDGKYGRLSDFFAARSRQKPNSNGCKQRLRGEELRFATLELNFSRSRNITVFVHDDTKMAEISRISEKNIRCVQLSLRNRFTKKL